LYSQDSVKLSNVPWVSLLVGPSDPDKCRDQHPLLVVLNADGSMALNADELTLHRIRPVFRNIWETRSDKRVFLKASGKVHFRQVVDVIKELESSASGVYVVLLTPKLETAPCAPVIPLRPIR
jgi:biopolymer transport protein ExbD